jgi:succinyl-CoA synthetase beta subunit
MKICEHEGKALFQKYGITVPKFELIYPETQRASLPYPIMLKSQVPASDRKAKGGIVLVESAEEFFSAQQNLFALPIDGYLPDLLLAEEVIVPEKEMYVSFSYSTSYRSPVLALNTRGGTGVNNAKIIPIDILSGVSYSTLKQAFGGHITEDVFLLVEKLWKLFCEEGVMMAEINPLFVLVNGSVVAGDAKVIHDDARADTSERPFIELGGDIAVIASGGGASMLNIDILMRSKGKPANYVEYSGNPKREIVEELTMRVLAQPNLKGAWVVGGTANFTDIFETMSGFVDGLRKITPKPTYPIVIRRDGPRQEEARAMLMDVAANEGYNMHVFGSEISMAESSVRLMKLMKKRT